jgi:PKD repeat protein
LSAPLAIYCNPALLKEGIMVITEGGTGIKAYKPNLNIKPVADFSVSDKIITAGSSVDFFDQSSYSATSWQWTFNGATTQSSSLQNPVGIVYNIPGIYDVQLLVQNTFGSDSIVKECQIEVLPSPLGTDFLHNDNFNIFPNPFTDWLNIESNTDLFQKAYQITDVYGRIVNRGVLSEHGINLGFLKQGIYFISFGEQKIVSHKIVRQ